MQHPLFILTIVFQRLYNIILNLIFFYAQCYCQFSMEYLNCLFKVSLIHLPQPSSLCRRILSLDIN